jgi:hypothetical protein
MHCRKIHHGRQPIRIISPNGCSFFFVNVAFNLTILKK